jgi:hypothetical protein
MKVLMLGWEFPPVLSGGLGMATYGIAKALRTRAEIKLILPRAEPSFTLDRVATLGLNHADLESVAVDTYAEELIGTEVRHVPMTLSPYHHINRILAGSSYGSVLTSGERQTIREIFSADNLYGPEIMMKVELYALLADQLANPVDYDVIHAHDWVTFLAGMRIKSRTHKPLVLHVHALETDRAGEHARNEIYELEKEALEAADRILAVSHYTRQQLHFHYQIAEDKIEVVHNGIEPQAFSRKTHKLKDKYVVFLGRITHQKGPDFLLETAEKVVRVLPNVKFVVAGSGDQFVHLLQSAAYKKLGSKFIFTGFLNKEKVDELLSMADVYFMPSVSEPFGLTALEAAQHKVPAVISKESGVSEVLKGALKADFWDTNRYANYIHALLTYETLHKVVSERSMRDLSSLTWDHTAEKIINIYQHLLRTH